MEKEKLIPIKIEDEMKSAYIDYSMSVIVSRALPDVRDGLKPVHRRVLFGMNEMGVRSSSSYKKSARIVGDVMGKYHPHGDSSVYDTMVRMAQEWSLRYNLVDGQGNFGSVDGDSPAAMRYTEARMQKISEELLSDIDKETVDFQLNFDDTIMEPTVLPTRVPALIINGASGIAVGMATNMPPHNLSEVIDGIMQYIDNNDITIDELIQYVKAPDFPTGGPYPLGYNGWGDIFVFIFFGPIAVCGTFFLQLGYVSIESIISGIVMGCLSVTLLCINNIRDVDTDSNVGKRTIAVRFGVMFVKYLLTLALKELFFQLSLYVFQFFATYKV